MINYYLDVFRKYAVFEGRARRSEYWYFTLMNFIIALVFFLIVLIITGSTESTELFIIGYSIFVLYALVCFVPSLALIVRRLHDVGKSGWFIFIGLIPIIGSIWLLVLYCTEGDSGPNEYGEDPKGGYNEADESEIAAIGEDL